jgi:hypothetical protein
LTRDQGLKEATSWRHLGGPGGGTNARGLLGSRQELWREESLPSRNPTGLGYSGRALA